MLATRPAWSRSRSARRTLRPLTLRELPRPDTYSRHRTNRPLQNGSRLSGSKRGGTAPCFRAVTAVLRFVFALAVNAVPAAGWFLEGWSAGTMLAVYWFETVAATFFIAARIAIHRRHFPCRGHFPHTTRKGHGRGKSGTFLSHFLTANLLFSAAHGFFLGMLLLLLTLNGRGAEVGMDWHSVGIGCGGVLLFLSTGFVMDLPEMRRRPFFWIEQMADGNFARVAVMQFAIIFGLVAVAFTDAPRAFFGVFIGLKTLTDLNAVVPQWDPAEPPRWLCWLMDRVPADPKSVKKGESFADFWKRDKAEEIARRRGNERPVS